MNRTESRLLLNVMGQRRLSNKMRFEQRPEGSVGVSHCKMSSKCKGPEAMFIENVKAVSAGGAG